MFLIQLQDARTAQLKIVFMKENIVKLLLVLDRFKMEGNS